MGDAISHAVLPGVAISFILGINFFHRSHRLWSFSFYNDYLYQKQFHY